MDIKIGKCSKPAYIRDCYACQVNNKKHTVTYRTSLKTFALFIIALAIQAICYSQKKTFIGLNLTGEYTSAPYNPSYFVTGFGGTFERRLNKHLGFETGIYYRTFVVHNAVFVNGLPFFNFTIKERYLSVPVLFTYHSSILNFSAGPAVDIYVGWNKTKQAKDYRLPETDESRIIFGLMGKVSRTIGITEKIIIEPEIRYNSIHYNKRSYYGIGVSGKYRLTK